MTLALILGIGLYLIGVAFLSALQLSHPDGRYWSKREARLRWFHGVVLWPFYALKAALWLIRAIPAGYVLQLVKLLQERRH